MRRFEKPKNFFFLEKIHFFSFEKPETGLYKIEDLQAHKNRQISRLAEELVEQFFSDESSAGENEENFCDRTAPSEFNE